MGWDGLAGMDRNGLDTDRHGAGSDLLLPSHRLLLTTYGSATRLSPLATHLPLTTYLLPLNCLPLTTHYWVIHEKRLRCHLNGKLVGRHPHTDLCQSVRVILLSEPEGRWLGEGWLVGGGEREDIGVWGGGGSDGRWRLSFEYAAPVNHT